MTSMKVSKNEFKRSISSCIQNMMNMIITIIIIMTMRVAAVTIRIGSVQNISIEKFLSSIFKIFTEQMF